MDIKTRLKFMGDTSPLFNPQLITQSYDPKAEIFQNTEDENNDFKSFQPKKEDTS